MGVSSTRQSETPVSLDRVLGLARQLELTDQARLLARLASDVEASLVVQQEQPECSPEERQSRMQAIQELYGSLSNVLPDSDDFARRKQEEIELEERRFESRA